MSHILHDESDSQIRKKSPSCIYICGKASYVRAFLSRQTHCLAWKAAKCLLQRQPLLVALIISAHMQKKGGGTFFIVITPSPYGIAFQTKKGGFEFSLVRTGKGCVCVCIRFLHKRGVDFSRHIAQLVSNAHF